MLAALLLSGCVASAANDGRAAGDGLWHGAPRRAGQSAQGPAASTASSIDHRHQGTATRALAPAPASPAAPSEPAIATGQASYYAHRFHGRTTASGEVFDMHALTAAHRTLPFGTLVRITNTLNGRSVIVRINDRGPFIEGRIIDLSLAAAEHLDMLDAGIVPVRLEPAPADAVALSAGQ